MSERVLKLDGFLLSQRADALRIKSKAHYYCEDLDPHSNVALDFADLPDMEHMAAWGLWRCLKALAFRSEPRDELGSSEGQPWSVARITKVLRISEATWGKLFPHLEAAGVAAWVGEDDVQVQACIADAPQPAPKPTDSAGFTLFWAAYPRKKSKVDARKAWGQMKCEPMTDTILAAVEANKAGNEQWREKGGQYIPYPASWLRDGGWDDVVGKAEVSGTGMTDTQRRSLAHLNSLGTGGTYEQA